MFVDWLEYVWKNKKWYNKIFQNSLQKIIIITCTIWTHRNNVIFGHQNNPASILGNAMDTYNSTMLQDKPLTMFVSKMVQAKILQLDITSSRIKLEFLFSDGWSKWNMDAFRHESIRTTTISYMCRESNGIVLSISSNWISDCPILTTKH